MYITMYILNQSMFAEICMIMFTYLCCMLAAAGVVFPLRDRHTRPHAAPCLPAAPGARQDTRAFGSLSFL